MTFEQFQNSGVYCHSLRDYFSEEWFDETEKGYVYAGNFWIAEQKHGQWWSLVGRDEKISGSISEVEQWLWDAMAKEALNQESEQ